MATTKHADTLPYLFFLNALVADCGLFFCFIFGENLYCLLLFFIPFLSIYNIYLRKLAPHRRLLATAKAPGKSSKREQFISFFFFFLRFIFLGRSASFSNSAVCALLETRLSSAWKGHAHVPLEARKVRQPKAIRKRIGKQNVETKEKLDKRLFIFLFSISSLSAYSVAA